MQPTSNPLRLLNQFEGFAVRFSEDFGKIESATAPEWDLGGLDSPRFSAAEFKMKLKEHFDALDPSSVDLLSELEKVKLALGQAQEIDAMVPICTPAPVDRRLERYHSELQGAAGELIVIYSDVRDYVLRCFIEWTRTYSLSDAAKRELVFVAIDQIVTIMKSGVWGEDLRRLVRRDAMITDNAARKLVWNMIVNPDIDDLSLRDKVNQLDFVRLFADFLDGMAGIFDCLTYREVQQIVGAVGAIRSLLLKIMPYSVADAAPTPRSELEARIEALEARYENARKAFHREALEDGLDISEIDQAIEAQVGCDIGVTSDLEALRTFAFQHLADQQWVDRDFDEVMIAATNGAYKLATIGCGSLLEVLLRELMYRRKEQVRALRKQKDVWHKVFQGNYNYADPDEPATWNLYTLILVARRIIGQEHSRLLRQCDHLRRARNSVHGGVVNEAHFLYGVSAVKGVLALMA